MRRTRRFTFTLILVALSAPALADEPDIFQPADVFELEWASDPQLSPDGERIAYVRNFMDVMSDRRRSNVWIVDVDGDDHRPLTSGNTNSSSPRWSPTGDRLLYVASADGPAQLHLRWMDAGQTAKITNLTQSPSGVAWSPDGKWIAFSMTVPEKTKPFAEMPDKPEGAEWAEPPKVIDRLIYRADGTGFLQPGFRHLFVVPAEGGSPRQLTTGRFNHGARPEWTPDAKHLVFSANRHADWEYEPNDSEVYELDVESGEIRALTARFGPDLSPAVSPDGRRVAYVGYDDRYQGYQLRGLYVMNRDGTNPRRLATELDRSVRAPRWVDEDTLVFRYDDQGKGWLGTVDLGGPMRPQVGGVGGLSLGRPYSSGQFSNRAARAAFTWTDPSHPAEIAVVEMDRPGAVAATAVVTKLNDDLFGHKRLAAVEPLWWKSAHDGRDIQGWVVKPPGFDPEQQYPLILEIHGGPFANYGDRFAAEIQLYAAAGYVVLYANPRGSTSYGEEFGNLIHHAYPGNDYDDLMSGVDALLAQGYVDRERLFVTGGSGGGVLTAWIVGRTDRFRAAVSAKPVINWYSFVLTADAYNRFYKYWFPGFPWDHPEEYHRRSPVSLAGNVRTPTMLLTGEVDYRTPMSESEQFYQALKLRQVDTALVRVPGASHGIARRPSQLVAKVAHVLEWFKRYGGPGDGADPGDR